MARWLMVPFALALCLFFVSEGSSGDKKKTTITGAVTNVEADKDAKDTGTLTVKTPEKKKKDVVVTEAKDYKIEVTKDTKIEKAGEKKKDPPTAAAFADLQKDQNVTVTLDGTKAEKILILFKKK